MKPEYYCSWRSYVYTYRTYGSSYSILPTSLSASLDGTTWVGFQITPRELSNVLFVYVV